MNILLTETEARVLGALVEKEIITPDYYPLSLNALMNACNQKSNRDPAMNLDEAAVSGALRRLGELFLARSASAMDSRVPKYEHRLQEVFNFTRPETAVLCELLLRGPQTPGELRSRAERMHHFDDLSTVHSTLQHLMKREPPVVKLLHRQPGTKEARYAHLLCGDVESYEALGQQSPAAASTPPHDDDRVTELENRVAALQREVSSLQQQFANLRKQFG